MGLQTSYRYGIYLSLERMTITKIHHSRNKKKTETTHYVLNHGHYAEGLIQAFEHDQKPNRVSCHICISSDFINQHVVTLNHVLPAKAIHRYFQLACDGLFQHPSTALYYDYLPIQDKSEQSQYLVIACKQAVIQQQLMQYLTDRCCVKSLQVDWLLGFHLAHHISSHPSYSVLYFDEDQITVYRHQKNSMGFYDMISTQENSRLDQSDLLEVLNQCIPEEPLYCFGPHQQQHIMDLVPLQSTALHEACTELFDGVKRCSIKNHDEFIATLTALTPMSNYDY